MFDSVTLVVYDDGSIPVISCVNTRSPELQKESTVAAVRYFIIFVTLFRYQGTDVGVFIEEGMISLFSA